MVDCMLPVHERPALHGGNGCCFEVCMVAEHCATNCLSAGATSGQRRMHNGTALLQGVCCQHGCGYSQLPPHVLDGIVVKQELLGGMGPCQHPACSLLCKAVRQLY